MRHRKVGRKLKRTKSHRRATLSALCTALILHKRIETTLAKAKEARRFVEKLITRAKKVQANENGSNAKGVSARREVFAFLRNKAAVSVLFKDIAQKVASRPGGYTRVVKLGRRLGDAAEIAVLELVDFNVAQEKSAIKSTKKSIEKNKRSQVQNSRRDTGKGSEKVLETAGQEKKSEN